MLYSKLQSVEEFLVGRKESLKNNDLFSSTLIKEDRRHSCYWEKDSDQLGLPIFVVPFESDFETIFADIATFYPSFSPISAYVHVCSEKTANALGVGGKKNGRSIKVDDRQIKFCLGTVLGEAVAGTLFDSQSLNSANVGYASCTQTLSYSIARAKMLYSDVGVREVANKWQLAHELTQRKTEKRISDAVVEMYDFFGEWSLSYKGRRSVSNNLDCDVLYQNLSGILSDVDLIDFFNRKFNIGEHAKAISGAFNDRISAFNHLVGAVESSSASERVKSACIAYYCNKILSGSFSHVGLLKDKVSLYPDIVIWYAVYACLSPECNVKTVASGIGLKLIRDLLSPFPVEERPSCDISVEELEVLSRVSLKASVVKPRHRRLMRVSLLPGVEIEIAFGEAEHGALLGMDAEAAQMDVKKIKSLLFEAIDLVEGKGRRSLRSDSYVSRTGGKKR